MPSTVYFQMVLKTATYSGMNLKGEIRESISLDEDDLSDVEDEVFIRDGKNGFKVSRQRKISLISATFVYTSWLRN